ncbi:MAG TPA: hypothetical protein VFJ79_02600 [Acidimicrobiales bacterium]|nr:hypothetical protein [Acidimicrobiales bacterium]
MAEPAFERTEDGSFEEPLIRLTHGEGTAADVTDTTQRVHSLIEDLERAMNGDWPTGAELRRLPPGDFGKLARELSLVIDRLNTLRIGLLGAGARSNARF